ncbi:hypothetical protein B0J13DRAFT_522738 [Dactylonectria estremocensis]|uniref:HypA-like protein n=1 Tax=Dactylonectria estremocensis TaxID=1079267 RepID=A0A9P9F4D1_9HYPO|nr:hypothetical protein B0J13DRAFT_522738 [Dactylonectria estremocensis]
MAATPFRIDVEPKQSGLLGLKLGHEEAAKVTELLQHDLDKHHVFFNAEGYHDHLVHHLLTLYGTGASTKDLQKAFDANVSYQLKAMEPRDQVVEQLSKDWSGAKNYVGKGRQYPSFLRFFQGEIERLGWQEVLMEYLFKDDERGRDLQSRLFGGLLHPLIQLMYGLEWEQPATIASGLAQIAVHDNRLQDFFTRSQYAANARPDSFQMGSIMDLYDKIGQNEKLATSARWEDPNRIYDGVLKRAPDEMIELASQVKVRAEDLEERTAEMIHTTAYVVTTAAFRPPHVPKLDFFLTHHATSAPFFLVLNKYPWIPTDVKVRLLETKIRMDLVQYIARGCPSLDPEAVFSYVPKDAASLVTNPEDLLPRIHTIVDDGHTVKLSRALILAQRASEPYAGRPWIQIAGHDAWSRAHCLLLDCNEHWEVKWVRAAGFKEAWEEIPVE